MSGEEEKKSWAPPEGTPTEEEVKEMEDHAKIQVDIATAPIAIFNQLVKLTSVLEGILVEVKRGNDLYIGDSLKDKPEDPSFTRVVETTDTQPAEVEVNPFVPPSSSVPQNLDTEAKIIDYYKGVVAQTTTRRGELAVTPEELAKFEFAVEEKRVLMKMPWIPKPRGAAVWASLNESVRNIGGEWHRDGKESCWILPKP